MPILENAVCPSCRREGMTFTASKSPVYIGPKSRCDLCRKEAMAERNAKAKAKREADKKEAARKRQRGHERRSRAKAKANIKAREKAEAAIANKQKLCALMGENIEGLSPSQLSSRIAKHQRKAKMAGITFEEYQAQFTDPEAENAERLATVRAERDQKAELLADQIRQEAIREILRRALCEKKLLRFIQAFDDNYEAGWVHEEICEELEQFLQDVVDKKSPRLMVFMPPRHGKSYIASQNFIVWALGKFPWLEIISTSYAISLPLKFSRWIRERIRDSDEYKQIFPNTQLSADSQAAEDWRTTKEGGYRAAGVGGGVTGMGGHILVVDDPFKDFEEADSETRRELVWNWYTTTLRTRSMPGGGILVIQTRWHDDDLSGRLVELMNSGDEYAETWKVISYPALAVEDEPHRKKDEPLHPERFSYRDLKRLERTMGPRMWGALYQQNPVPDDGSYFRKDMWRYYHQAPPASSLKVYMAFDCAISKNEDADYTAGFVVGEDDAGNWFVLDRIYGHYDGDEIITVICDAIETWRPTSVFLEKEKVTQALGGPLEREIRKRRLTWAHIELVSPGKRDKTMRARPLQSVMKRGLLFWPHADWTDHAQREFLRFPSGKHDDQIDALAYVFLEALYNMTPQQPKDPKKLGWKDKMAKMVRAAVGASSSDHMGA